jgi:hypothetical protein
MDEVRGRSSAATGRQLPMAEGRKGGLEEKESVTANLYLLRHEIRLPRSYSHELSQSMVALKLSTLIILQQSLTANLQIPLPRCIVNIMTCAHHQPTLMNFRRFAAASAT